jgi:methylated-DNA-[protein]-cysteine S-methyltransferase
MDQLPACRIYIGETPQTPLGAIWIAQSENGLISLLIRGAKVQMLERLMRSGLYNVEEDAAVIEAAAIQICEYLDGQRKVFDLAIDWERMPAFQRSALQATCTIPYGKTATYKEIAGRIGNPRAARAVGRAEATNPLPLVIPCHRVLGSDGKLHGYGAADGLQTKAWLLKLEMAT